MADDNVKYQHKTVQAIRGTEARSIAKWEGQGWELIDQTPGKLRTTLNFRKLAPKVPWLPIAALLGVGVLILAIVGIASLFQGDDNDTPATAAATSTPTPSDTPSETAAETPTEEPGETPTETDDADEVITAKNNDDFAALLVGGECDKAVKTFATDNADRTIEFDGGIADMAPHGSYDTRYDILITPGDKGPNAAIGPYFKFEDVNTGDLNFTGDVPNRFGTGDLIHVVADVDEYNPQTCLFFLEPVSTEFRK
ncbi:DUF4839 domain-containing protein [Nocardioides sp. URHA0032]|uniref:DUF4839 domain-containing protein n=1 Tax=Nocardioides sp. URHA0032 TaxID=1380388 RepID=UPI00048E62A3|nr:DUF4839 domain-containing protein [Nocardioides sp. URHA0032]